MPCRKDCIADRPAQGAEAAVVPAEDLVAGTEDLDLADQAGPADADAVGQQDGGAGAEALPGQAGAVVGLDDAGLVGDEVDPRVEQVGR